MGGVTDDGRRGEIVWYVGKGLTGFGQGRRAGQTRSWKYKVYKKKMNKQLHSSSSCKKSCRWFIMLTSTCSLLEPFSLNSGRHAPKTKSASAWWEKQHIVMSLSRKTEWQWETAGELVQLAALVKPFKWEAKHIQVEKNVLEHHYSNNHNLDKWES